MKATTKAILTLSVLLAISIGVIGVILYGYLNEKKAHDDTHADLAVLARFSAADTAGYIIQLTAVHRGLVAADSLAGELEEEARLSAARERASKEELVRRTEELQRARTERDERIRQLDRLIRESAGEDTGLAEAIERLRGHGDELAAGD